MSRIREKFFRHDGKISIRYTLRKNDGEDECEKMMEADKESKDEGKSEKERRKKGVKFNLTES